MGALDDNLIPATEMDLAQVPLLHKAFGVFAWRIVWSAIVSIALWPALAIFRTWYPVSGFSSIDLCWFLAPILLLVAEAVWFALGVRRLYKQLARFDWLRSPAIPLRGGMRLAQMMVIAAEPNRVELRSPINARAVCWAKRFGVCFSVLMCVVVIVSIIFDPSLLNRSFALFGMAGAMFVWCISPTPVGLVATSGENGQKASLEAVSATLRGHARPRLIKADQIEVFEVHWIPNFHAMFVRCSDGTRLKILSLWPRPFTNVDAIAVGAAINEVLMVDIPIIWCTAPDSVAHTLPAPLTPLGTA